jgi:zinc/manganese transport system permease protein
MSEAVALLWPAFLMALCLVGIHSYFGIQVLARNVIFVDLALAQFAALGATLAFMLGHPAQGLETYLYSFGSTLIAAVLLAFTRAWSGRVSQEALIGVIYVVAAAAAILLIDRAPQGAEHLKQILTGNILTTGLDELKPIVPLYAAIGLLHWALRDRIAAGQGHAGWDFLFYASFGLVVTSSVAVAGVLLVFSFLIVPAAIGVLYGQRLGVQLAIGWIAGTLASAAGLAASFAFDLPTGATMVCAFGAALALAGIFHPFLREDRGRAWRRTFAILRGGAAAILAGSALLWMAAPRADQPLLDSAEYAVPALRGAYFNAREAAVHADAAEYAARYRREAEALNEREIASRAGGAALDDDVVRRISSFVRSYGEMIKGEEFVLREVRSRARERWRWAGGLLLVLALFVMPGGPARLWRRSAGLLRRREGRAP